MSEKEKKLYSSEAALKKLRIGYLCTIIQKSFLSYGTFFLFITGLLVLVFKQVGWDFPFCGYWAAAGFLFVYAFFRIRKEMPERKVFIATLDRANNVGGILMAEDELDDKSWSCEIGDGFVVPVIKKKCFPDLCVFFVALLFFVVCLKVPVIDVKKFDRRIDLSRKIAEIEEQVSLLEEEKIIDSEEKKEIEIALEKIEENSNKNDPGISFEALDLLQEKLCNEASKEISKRITDIELLKKLEDFAKKEKREKALEKIAKAAELSRKMAEQGLVSPKLTENLLKETEKLNSEGKMEEKKSEGQENNFIAVSEGSNSSGSDEDKKMGTNGKGGVSKDDAGETALTFGERASDYNGVFHNEVLPESNLESVSETEAAGIGVSAPEVINEMNKAGTIDIGNGKTATNYREKIVLPKYRNAVKNYFSN